MSPAMISDLTSSGDADQLFACFNQFRRILRSRSVGSDLIVFRLLYKSIFEQQIKRTLLLQNSVEAKQIITGVPLPQNSAEAVRIFKAHPEALF